MPRASWASTCGAPWAWRSGLYEGVDLGPEGSTGLITYMRTDSPRVAPEAKVAAREWIASNLGKQYLPDDAQRVQGQEGRAGRARSHPAHRRGAHAGVDCEVPERRAAQAVPADLAAVCGFADDAGDLRRDYGEDRRSFSEDRARPTTSACRGSVLRFDGFLKVYEVAGRQERRRRGRVEEQAAQP